MQEASTLTKSAGKLRLVHLLEEGPLNAAAPSTSSFNLKASTSKFNLKATLATFGKIALLLAVLGVAWQSRDVVGTQYTLTPMVSQILGGQRTTITIIPQQVYESTIFFLACTHTALIHSCVHTLNPKP